MHSKVISDAILRISPKLVRSDAGEKLIEGMQTMGPGCIFDDFSTEEEAQGGLKVLLWLEQHLDYHHD